MACPIPKGGHNKEERRDKAPAHTIGNQSFTDDVSQRLKGDPYYTELILVGIDVINVYKRLYYGRRME